MRTVLIAAAAAAALAGLAPSAAAQTAADRADMRCLLVLQAVSQDPKQKDSATRGIYFYIGRLAARGPLSRVETLLPSEGRAIGSAQQAQAELTRCGTELTQRTGEFQAASQRAAQAARAAAPPPKPKAK